ncbi:hypothetical protein FRC08_002757 [Ceratobasidium sp. 394]|nr:hypothetical protein FRC08_002757 [Ceratobasidium sp. 394]
MSPSQYNLPPITCWHLHLMVNRFKLWMANLMGVLDGQFRIISNFAMLLLDITSYQPLDPTNGQTFRDLLREKSTDIFPGMWCREIPSPDVFLQHLKIRPAPDEDYNIPTMSTQERIISEAIQRYFTIPGHPDCPALRAIIPSHEFTQHGDDPALRARLFILAATGSRSTPTEPGWRIVVDLAKEHENRPDQGGPHPLHWHLCARTVTLTYDDDLVNACLEPVPSGNPTFSRRFERWFHSQVYNVGPDTFSSL